jgi:hypothetical protein
MMITFLRVLALYRLVDVNVSEKHAVYIFRAEVAMLGSGGIYIGLEDRQVPAHISSLTGSFPQPYLLPTQYKFLHFPAPPLQP